MSYDFELYTNREFSLTVPGIAKDSLRLDGPDRVEDEDIPDAYLPILGRKRVLYRIHLSGGLTVAARAEVDQWLGAIVEQTKGVLIDLQTEQFETVSKRGLFQPEPAKDRANGSMSFYFEGADGFYEHGFENMLAEIARLMPQALPVRFGHYEPLQGRVENGDMSELIAAYKAETDIILKAKTPFGHILPGHGAIARYHAVRAEICPGLSV